METQRNDLKNLFYLFHNRISDDSGDRYILMSDVFFKFL